MAKKNIREITEEENVEMTEATVEEKEEPIDVEAKPIEEPVEKKKPWWKNWKVIAGIVGATVGGITIAAISRKSSDKDIDYYDKCQEAAAALKEATETVAESDIISEEVTKS